MALTEDNPAAGILARCKSDAIESCRIIAATLQPIIPKGFRGKISITVDAGEILPSNVSIEMRPPQGRKP